MGITCRHRGMFTHGTFFATGPDDSAPGLTWRYHFEDGHWPGLYLRFSESGAELGQLGSYKGQTHQAKYLAPSPNQGQSYILPNFVSTTLLPISDQTHPVQLGQPTLFIEVKTCNLLSYKNKSSQHSRKLSVLG